MNFFGGLTGFGHGNGGTNNCVCTLVWLIFLLSICGCKGGMFGGENCLTILILLLLISSCGMSTPCGNN